MDETPCDREAEQLGFSGQSAVPSYINVALEMRLESYLKRLE